MPEEDLPYIPKKDLPCIPKEDLPHIPKLRKMHLLTLETYGCLKGFRALRVTSIHLHISILYGFISTYMFCFDVFNRKCDLTIRT